MRGPAARRRPRNSLLYAEQSALHRADFEEPGAGVTPILLLRPGEDRLEMGRLIFPRHSRDFNLLEPGLFQPTVQVAFREPQPAVAIEFARPVEVMLGQIQNHNLPA